MKLTQNFAKQLLVTNEHISTEFKSNKFDSSLIFFTFIEHKTSEFAAYHNTYLLYLTMRTMYSIHLHTCGESSCYDP